MKRNCYNGNRLQLRGCGTQKHDHLHGYQDIGEKRPGIAPKNAVFGGLNEGLKPKATSGRVCT